MLDKNIKRPALLHSVDIKHKPVNRDFWMESRKVSFSTVALDLVLVYSPVGVSKKGSGVSGDLVFVDPLLADKNLGRVGPPKFFEVRFRVTY